MRVFWSRWLFLVLGGALAAPYALLAIVGLPLAVPDLVTGEGLTFVLVALVVVVVALVVTSFLPIFRVLEAAVVPGLLRGRAERLSVPPVRAFGDRLRGSAWYLLHTIVGAAVSILSLVVPPIAVALLLSTVKGQASIPDGWLRDQAPAPGLAVALALALVAALVLLAAATGSAAAWAAPVLLGPDLPARLEELERRTADLTERSRLARELHDSIGHALTVTTLQAGAARTVLHTDPAFAEDALLAIEQTTRVAAADLDDVLGVLREESASRAPQPALRDLEALVTAHRDAGLGVRMSIQGEMGIVPAVVSREVYRIVQEGLTNVQRHANVEHAEVDLTITSNALTVQVRNPAGAAARASTDRGGYGLVGIRERIELLGGALTTGPTGDGGWLLAARVPIGADGR